MPGHSRHPTNPEDALIHAKMVKNPKDFEHPYLSSLKKVKTQLESRKTWNPILPNQHVHASISVVLYIRVPFRVHFMRVPYYSGDLERTRIERTTHFEE